MKTEDKEKNLMKRKKQNRKPYT